MSSLLRVRPLSLLLALSAIGGAVACGAPAGDPQSSGAATYDEEPANSVAASTAPARHDESVRVQKFLDARYKASDVRHSFTTKVGEAIDCVDFFATPGVKSMAAKGMPITAIPHFDVPAEVRARVEAKAKSGPIGEDLSFNGSLDDDGNARTCPEGSVPTIRLTAERIAAAGGLDAFVSRGRAHEKAPPPKIPAPGLPEFPGYGHVQASYDGVKVVAGISTMTIAQPTMPSNAAQLQDHSLAQTWTYGGSSATPGCGASCFQTVEAGWTIDPRQFGDGSPHLFIYGTADGWNDTGCYDNESWTGPCLDWIPIAGAKFTLGQQITTVSTPGGAQDELTVYTLNGAPGAWPGWVITVGIGSTATVLGYYPLTDYGTGPMSKDATDFQVGGEVYDAAADSSGNWLSPPTVPMGMDGLGVFVIDEGYTWTAVQHDYGYFNGSAWVYTQLTPLSTRSSYTWNTSAAKGSTSWQNYFYYGDYIPFRIIKL